MEKMIHNPAYRHLIATLCQARRRMGLGQRDAAKRLGVSRTWIQKIEQHELRLDVLHLIKVCRAYGLKARNLVQAMDEELSDEDGSFFYLLETGRVISACGTTLRGSTGLDLDYPRQLRNRPSFYYR